MTALPAVDHAARRERLRGELDRHGIDTLLVTKAVDVRWLTGLDATFSQVLVSTDPSLDRLTTDNRYAEAAERLDLEVVARAASAVLDPEDRQVELAGTRLGYEADHLTVAAHDRLADRLEDLELVPITGLVAGLRRRKDAAELARLRHACALTSAGWDWLVATVAVGMTEREVARGLVRHLEDLGADGPAFDFIVAGGPNAAIPHHRPTGRPLQDGDVLKVDFGARVDGYHADCTRTLAFGDPEPRLRAVYDAVHAAQQAGVEAAVVGATAEQVHDAAIGMLDELDLGPTLHGVGHGVGLEIHESPILSSEPGATLDAGFVVTVEPGVYLTGVGGVRIEDTVAVTADGPERLTTADRDLVIL